MALRRVGSGAPGAAAAPTQAEARAAISAGTDAGYVNPVVAKTFALDEVAAVHEHLVPPSGQPATGTAGNFVLLP